MFKPHILALKGPSNTGKTTIIKRVRSKILGYFGDQATETDFLSKRATSDIKRIIEIGEFKIGIESQGDPVGPSKGLGRLHDSLKYFVEQGCHLIVCTSRESGKTAEYINVYESKYTIISYKKIKEPESKMESMWNITATEIFNKVVSLYDDFKRVK
ncbi:hypothetical protein AB5B87_001393 [Providencia rettgeri]|uniref:hypothetical protein n=1 Tax=Providencia rettgeri TaxID=587 RepID=UPI002880FEA2|nr:hypothetical protein [Providencia rettgeri]ELM3936162.1 hypothetical protein [Providencia rettgeri]EMA4643913.1 hypothetical protein [Providencia rettgeri]MDK3107689.1 hypothetical protein [Providencia rettgeri]WRR95381.1 hypothetical protein VNI59_11375 [Providencia rettgeri]